MTSDGDQKEYALIEGLLKKKYKELTLSQLRGVLILGNEEKQQANLAEQYLLQQLKLQRTILTGLSAQRERDKI